MNRILSIVTLGLLLSLAALAPMLQGCATTGALDVGGSGYVCDLDAFAAVDLDQVDAGASGYCAAQIPGGGPGVLVGFLGQVYAVAILAGETPEEAQARALAKIAAPNITWED